MAWLQTIVRHTRDALWADDGEDPDETLARALGVKLEADPEDEDPYRALARVDQVVYFFEYDAPALEGYMAEDAAFAEELERKRVQYYNMVNSVDVQHQRIAHLVDELLQLRARLRRERAQRKEILLEINRVKLDIGDVKNKRYFKDRARKEAMAEIVPMIVKVKTARLLAEQEYEQKAASHAGVTIADAQLPKLSADRGSNADGTAAPCSEHTVEPVVLSKGAGPARRRRHYTDKELNQLLRDDD